MLRRPPQRVSAEQAAVAESTENLAQRFVTDLAGGQWRQLPVVASATLDEAGFLQHPREILQLASHRRRLASQQAANGVGIHIRRVVGLDRVRQALLDATDIVHVAH